MSSLAPPYKKLKIYRYKTFFSPLCNQFIFYRVQGWLLWFSTILIYLILNVVFSVLIQLDGNNPKTYLIVLRVVTLDGLFLVMGVTLAVCIMIVSMYM